MGAAMLDRIGLTEKPVADAAVVELSDAEMTELVRIGQAVPARRDEQLSLEVMQPTGAWARWHATAEATPETGIMLTAPRVALTHRAGATEIAVDLLPRCEGAYARFGRSNHTRRLPAAVTLGDGTHFVATMCPTEGWTLVTELVVGPRAR